MQNHSQAGAIYRDSLRIKADEAIRSELAGLGLNSHEVVNAAARIHAVGRVDYSETGGVTIDGVPVATAIRDNSREWIRASAESLRAGTYSAAAIRMGGGDEDRQTEARVPAAGAKMITRDMLKAGKYDHVELRKALAGDPAFCLEQ